MSKIPVKTMESLDTLTDALLENLVARINKVADKLQTTAGYDQGQRDRSFRLANLAMDLNLVLAASPAKEKKGD